MAELRPLFSLLRGGAEELRTYGEVAVAGPQGLIYQTSESQSEYPARSLLKPFQFWAAGLPAERWVAETRYTPCLGSVSATEAQARQLEAWGTGLSERRSRLQVPPTFPQDERYRVLLKDQGKPPLPLYHHCYSKHLAILESCELHRWDTGSYTSPAHPYQLRLRQCLGELLGEDLGKVRLVSDGCTLPTPVLTTGQLTRLYQKLAVAAPESELGKIRAKMLADPQWIAGPDRLDTRLMQENPGLLVAKEGADGLLGLACLPSERFPEGLGIVTKLASGYHPSLMALALTPLLQALGLTPVAEVPRGQEVVFHYQPWGVPSQGFVDISPSLHEGTAVFPGDKPFRRVVSLDTQRGQHLTLSSVETTVHVGAHTDAPNHTTTSPAGIDTADLEIYAGPCQVIALQKAANQSIAVADLAGTALRAKRVLFKTGSFPNPDHFNSDFVSLSAELMTYLGENGVRLVGIDTPSVDPATSKDLPAHHAAARHKIALLEGILLEGIEPGLYRLSALPLRLRNADASPVRAVLSPLT